MTGRKSEHKRVVEEARGDYDALLASQGGHCALCPNEPKTRRLHIDHNHKTMQRRGLLCYRCNRFLHEWMSPEWLRAAADYKEKYG